MTTHRIATLFVFLLTLTILSVACTTTEKSDWSKDDSANLESIVRKIGKKRHGVMTADFSDPKQLAYTKKMLASAGVTEDKYPEIHRSLATAAKTHAVKKPTNASLLQLETTDTTSLYDFVDVQYLSSPDDVNFTAQGIASFANIPDNVTTTLQLYNAETFEPIGNSASNTTWGNTPSIVTLVATGTRPSGSQWDVLAVLSSTINSSSPSAAEDGSGGYYASLEADDFPKTPPVVSAPVQTSTSNEWPNNVKVCLGRNAGNNYNCDYCFPNCNSANPNPPIVMPLAGNVTFKTSIQQPTATNTTIIAAMMPPSGGACDPLQLTTQSLLSGLTTSVNNTVLNWTYNPTPSFGSPCWASGQNVYVTYTITVTQTNNNTVDVNVNNTTATTCPPTGGQTPNSSPFCPVVFVWGCLAAETPIRMADGSNKPISQVDISDKIISDANGKVLTVSDTIIGDEKMPMFRIRDEKGHEVLTTSGHAFTTPGGTRLAKTLKAGDTINTVDGPAKIASIQPESYTGKVYNLVLGVGNEHASLNDDNRTMVAGGIIVGDNRMQTLHGRRFNEAPVNVAARIAPRWRSDYQRWLDEHSQTKK